MVTLRRAPQYERKGPKLEPYQVILRPLITEKATHLSERHNAYSFEVHPQATKTENWTVEAVDVQISVGAGTFTCLQIRKQDAGGGVDKVYWFARGVGKIKETGGQEEALSTFDVQ